ncbi:MAG TPA: hypothetical protein VII56_14545 [Rhizomicrobium sp.]
MRAIWIGLAALAVTGTPATACNIQVLPGHIVAYASTDAGGADIPTVTRGDQFAIACDGITAPGADVRVVMSLSNPPGEQPTGYAAVLATNQKVTRHAVAVQVPDVPDFANHTVSVKVYVTDAKGTKACDAGRVHIV